MILEGDIFVDPRNGKECYVATKDICGGITVDSSFFRPINGYPELVDPAEIHFARMFNNGLVEFFVKDNGWVY